MTHNRDKNVTFCPVFTGTQNESKAAKINHVVCLPFRMEPVKLIARCSKRFMEFFSYETYQDVRKNLFFYSLPSLIVAGFFCYWRILPLAHQAAIWSVFSYVSNSEGWKIVSGGGVGIVLFSAIAYLMTEVFQVHDQVWDKYVKKWRYYYAIDYILPRLVQPFACHLNYRFMEEAETRVGAFQKELYYPFVGDRDAKIPKNKLVRFYEVITVYWLTQINEIVLFILGTVLTAYAFSGPADLGYRTLLLGDCGILILLFLVNRLWAGHALAKVRRATEEEIRAIHADGTLLAELESRLKNLCSNYSIPYT